MKPATITTSDAHLTSTYILQDEKGKLHHSSYRPTENFRHHRTSGADAWTLECGCFMDTPTHDYWIGDAIDCHIGFMAAWGIETYNVKLKIVAKSKCIWDYSKPVGERSLDAKSTKNYIEMLTKYRNQAK